MRLDSIRYRLIILIGLCLIGMVALVVTQVININRLIDAQTDATLLLDLNNEILQLRRNEKDLMLRQDLDYVSQFESRAEALSERLNELERLFSNYQLPASQLDKLRSSLSEYWSQFISLSENMQAIGLDEHSGQQGAMRSNARQLEENLRHSQHNESLLTLLQLRRLEKDFMQRQELSYVDEAAIVAKQLQTEFSANNQTENSTLLNHYSREFSGLVEAYQRVGFDQDSGIQGAFRAAAHDLEEELASIRQTLNPLINQREQDVKTWGFVIAILTVLTLLTLLIRNFMTLQTTLSTFLQFFHQSKREYQLLDTKKMGFAEFRLLAQVANEMVDARRDMEAELRTVKEKLAAYEAKDSSLG